MGSFYSSCSITGMTLPDGVEMYIQFLLPAQRYGSPETSNMFVESFLRVAKDKGLEEAIKSFEESTKTWVKDNLVSEKGLLCSNEGATVNWIPFGPAIKGTYDDYGNCAPIDSPENNIKLAILKEMTGLEYETLESAATDDRWITLGLNGDDRQNGDWGLSGLPENYQHLDLLKGLSMTHFNAGAYETMVAKDFSPINGIANSNDYDDKRVNDRLKKIKSNVNEYKKYKDAKLITDPVKKLEAKWKLRELEQDMGPAFRQIDSLYKKDFIDTFFKCSDFDWYAEQQKMVFSLSYLNIPLRQSEYGSQEKKWKGLTRIWQEAIKCNSKLGPEYGENELTEEETLTFDMPQFKELTNDIMLLVKSDNESTSNKSSLKKINEMLYTKYKIYQ